MNPAEILAAQQRRHREQYGITVRCPRCNAGIGKFCLREGVTVHQSAADIVTHAERVALANAKEIR